MVSTVALRHAEVDEAAEGREVCHRVRYRGWPKASLAGEGVAEDQAYRNQGQRRDHRTQIAVVEQSDRDTDGKCGGQPAPLLCQRRDEVRVDEELLEHRIDDRHEENRREAELAGDCTALQTHWRTREQSRG